MPIISQEGAIIPVSETFFNTPREKPDYIFDQGQCIGPATLEFIGKSYTMPLELL